MSRQKSSSANRRAKWQFSRLWSKSSPKVKLCKLLGQSDNLQALVEIIAKSQALQTPGQSDVLQALIKIIAKNQASQTARQSDVLRALVDTIAKSQALPNPPGKVKFSRLWSKQQPKVKALQTVGVKWRSPGSGKNHGQKSSVKLLKLPGKVTFWRLWLKSSPKVKLCNLSGKVTFSRLSLKS